jgi:arylformamidase
LKLLDLTAESPVEGPMHKARSGTHIQAPASLIPGGKNLGEFPLDSFMVQAVLLDVTSKAGQQVDDEDLEAAEERAGLSLREGEAAILHTGWGDSTSTRAGHYAYLSENGAEFLEFKRPSMVATDAPSLDATGNDQGQPAHSVLMRAEILVLENLRNLGMVQESRFRLIAFPLIVNGSASPVRAVAVLEG